MQSENRSFCIYPSQGLDLRFVCVKTLLETYCPASQAEMDTRAQTLSAMCYPAISITPRGGAEVPSWKSELQLQFP